MNDIAATPAENNNGEIPLASSTATPANNNQGNQLEGEKQPEGGIKPESDATVTLSKEEHAQLQKDASRARSNQSKADRYDRLSKAGRISQFNNPAPAGGESSDDDERAEAAVAEDRKAEKGLMALAADPAYREALDTDPTLRQMLTTNPLSILPMFAPDALDAEDAISLVKEELSKRNETAKNAKQPPKPNDPPADDKKKDDKGSTPPAGGVNPPSGTTPDAEYEDARKNPNTESAISGMIKVGLKRQGGK